jgi:hypothetical protein
VPGVVCARPAAARNPMTVTERYIGIVLDGLRAPGQTKLPPG